LLNRLPDHLVPAWHEVVQGPHGAVTVAHASSGFGPIPPTSFDARHALSVIAVYAVVFVVVSVVLTARRDVLE
jgi:NhaP-type Na+/H+ or K+/H+ antiporter